MEVDEVIQRIISFFKNKKDVLESNLDKSEKCLLKNLHFEKELGLEEDNKEEKALFGYGSVISDYRPKGDKNTIIEVKYIKISKTKSGTQYHECEVKNSLSQIIEQAVCKNVKNAILLIIDAGRANNRAWNANEGKFISMFQLNPFNINLKVVRIRVQKGKDGEVNITSEVV